MKKKVVCLMLVAALAGAVGMDGVTAMHSYAANEEAVAVAEVEDQEVLQAKVVAKGNNWQILDNGVLAFAVGTRVIVQDTTWATRYNEYIKEVIIPEGVTKIGHQTFRGLTNLVAVELPSTITEIEYLAFEGCTSLKTINIPKSLASCWLRSDAHGYHGIFSGCTALTDVTFEEGIERIPGQLFYSCSGLTELEIPSSVKEIGAKAFYSCDNLEKITFMGNVKKVGDAAIGYNTTIYAYEETAAQTFAETYKYNFVSLGKMPWDIMDNPFFDVYSDEWQYKPAAYCYSKGLMKGKGQSASGLIKFDPDGNITRAEFAQVLYNMEGCPEVTYSKRFTDVPDNQWFTKAIIWAAEKGIVKGKGDRYDVSGKATREELATMFRNYAKYKEYSLEATGDISQFTDSAKISKWAVENMKWAVGQNIMKGKGTKMDPTGTATRAECAAMLKNFMDAFVEE